MIVEILLIPVILLSVLNAILNHILGTRYKKSFIHKILGIFDAAWVLLGILLVVTAGAYMLIASMPVDTFGNSIDNTSIKEYCYVSQKSLQEIQNGKYVIRTGDDRFYYKVCDEIESEDIRNVFVIFSNDTEYTEPMLITVKLEPKWVYPFLIRTLFPAYKTLFVLQGNEYEYTKMPKWLEDLRSGGLFILLY